MRRGLRIGSGLHPPSGVRDVAVAFRSHFDLVDQVLGSLRFCSLSIRILQELSSLRVNKENLRSIDHNGAARNVFHQAGLLLLVYCLGNTVVYSVLTTQVVTIAHYVKEDCVEVQTRTPLKSSSKRAKWQVRGGG
jgi:hypothetical protein